MGIKVAKIISVVAPIEISTKALGIFENHILDIITQKPNLVSIDCSKLEQVTSRHINALWLAYLYCKETGIEVCLSSPTDGLIRVLKILDLYDLFMFDHDTIRTRMRKAVRSISSEYSNTYADEFHPDAEDINRAMAAFGVFLSKLGITSIIEFELKTIFYEVATNIRNHAGLSANELIVFTARINQKRIILVFADSGRPFDLSKSLPPLEPAQAGREGNIRGFGIAMIQRLLDDIYYKRIDDDINVLTLEKEMD